MTLDIVIYEEDYLTRALLQEWLGQARYRVHVGRPHDPTLDRPADLVIVNVYMPKHAGAQCVREIRAAHPEYADYRDLGPVSLRSVRCRCDRTDSRGTAGHREAARPRRSAGCGARYNRRAGLVHAAQSDDLSKTPMLHPMRARFASSACGSESLLLGALDHPRFRRLIRVRRLALLSLFTRTRPIARSPTWRTPSPSKPHGPCRPSIFCCSTPRDGIAAKAAGCRRSASTPFSQDRTGGVQQVRQVMIVDAQGNQRYGSRGSASRSHNVSDRSYFIAQRDGTAAGLFMSEPLVTRSEGRAAVVLSRRLDDEQGEFRGRRHGGRRSRAISSNSIAPSTSGMGSAIQLVRDDGTLLARNPARPGCGRAKVPGAPGRTDDACTLGSSTRSTARRSSSRLRR